MQRKIVHCDMDSYYAAVEQRDDPALRGRPIAVGSPKVRGVLATASYEARAFGVRSAMPSVKAMRLCPDLIIVPPRFEVYREISMQIRAIFAEYTDVRCNGDVLLVFRHVEISLSLDEAYLDVTENKQNIPIATDIANMIRARIKEETGLTASAGVAGSKFLAKMASGMNKPNGTFVIPPSKAEAFMEQLEIEKFHGVGPATAAHLKGFGIKTGADLKAFSLQDLERILNPRRARYFHDLCRGIDEREVQPDRERKSIGAEDTFATDISTLEEARQRLAPIAEKVWSSIVKRELTARTATLKIRFSDFTQITRARTGARALRSKQDLDAVIDGLLVGEFPAPKSVRLLGVTLSGFEDPALPSMEQLSLAI